MFPPESIYGHPDQKLLMEQRLLKPGQNFPSRKLPGLGNSSAVDLKRGPKFQSLRVSETDQ